MAGAIIRSIIASGRVAADHVAVYDVIHDKANGFADLGVHVSDSVEDACKAGDVWLLAVKPQDYESLLLSLKPFAAEKKVTVISIAAAISTSFVCSVLDKQLPVVRVMPNTPLLLGCGATAISRNALVDDRLYTKICGLFAASGSVVSLEEDKMNAVISVNSSSPAYVYLLAKAMIDGAVAQGFTPEIASPLVFQTIKGAAEMLINGGKTPDELIKVVASPGGTTLAALKALDDGHFCETVADGMNACTARAKELAR